MDKTIRLLVRGTYDLQKLRIQMGNRIVGQFKARVLGQTSGKSEKELRKEAKEVLKRIRKNYRIMMDALKGEFPKIKDFKGDEIISSYTELALIHTYIEMEKQEKHHFSVMSRIVRTHPMWDAFFAGVSGCGTAMSGVIISEVDISKAKHVSSIWKYAGLDVAPDGKGRSRRPEHLIDVEYINKDGEKKTKKSITFNPFLKTKLLGVLGPCLRREKKHYAQVYNEKRAQVEGKVKNPHRYSLRFMIKRFLKDMFGPWKEINNV